MSWKSPYEAAKDTGPLTDRRAAVRRKKKTLTQEQKIKNMKGISKAFVKADSGGGWAKIQPVHKKYESESSSDDSDEDIAALLRTQTKQLQPDNQHMSPTSPIPLSQTTQEESTDEEDDGGALLRAQTKQFKEGYNMKHKAPLKPQPRTRKDLPSQKNDEEKSNVDRSAMLRVPTNNIKEERKQKASTIPPTLQSPHHSNAIEMGKASQLKVLQRILQMVGEQGQDHTLKWIQEQVDRGGSGLLALPKELSLVTKQEETNTKATPYQPMPHPKRKFFSTNAVELERRFIQYFRQAAEVVPHEYTTLTATLLVRRPYGLDNQKLEEIRGLPCSNNADYGRRAHISNPTTLEVTVLVDPDVPILFLGIGGIVNYRTSPGSKFQPAKVTRENFKVLEACCYYSYRKDTQGAYQKYALDELLQHAFWVRDNFCSTMTSTALGLQAQKSKEAVVPDIKHDMAVDTSDLTRPNESSSNNKNPKSGLQFSLNKMIRQPLVRLSRVSFKTFIRVLLLLSVAMIFYLLGLQDFVYILHKNETNRELTTKSPR